MTSPSANAQQLQDDGEGVCLIYDGGCPMCRAAAESVELSEEAGALSLVNARRERANPAVREVTARGLDLDEGIAVRYRGEIYHGHEAMQVLASLRSGKGWFNRLNRTLFRTRTLAALLYPPLRAVRSGLLRWKGIGRIGLTADGDPLGEPILRRALGREWAALPEIIRRRYAVRPYSDDRVVVEGALDIEVSRFVGLLARTTGLLPSFSARGVPTTVIVTADPESGGLLFDRRMRFPGRGEVRFTSRMEPAGGSEIIEFLRFGLGCRFEWQRDGERLIFHGRGYLWRVFGFSIPLHPWLTLGPGHANEAPISAGEFRTEVGAAHPLFGRSFCYAGTFRIVETQWPAAS